MADILLADVEIEALIIARTRLMALPHDRIIDAQTAPVTALKYLTDGLAGDDDTARAAVLAFTKAVNELCDGALRKNGRVNVSAVEAAEQGFEVLGDRFDLGGDDPLGHLRTLRNTRAKARGLDVARIDTTVAARAAARAAKDFDSADRLHDELVAQGVQLVDSVDGASWTLVA